MKLTCNNTATSPPPMEMVIFHFGDNANDDATSLATDIQSALELRYPELNFELLTAEEGSAADNKP